MELPEKVGHNLFIILDYIKMKDYPGDYFIIQKVQMRKKKKLL
jgi:hypothetical protein